MANKNIFPQYLRFLRKNITFLLTGIVLLTLISFAFALFLTIIFILSYMFLNMGNILVMVILLVSYLIGKRLLKE